MDVAAVFARAAARPPWALGALGLASGALSAGIGFEFAPRWLQWPGAPFLLTAEMVPIGAFFAAAIALGLWLVSHRAIVLPVAALATLYAWSGALHAAIGIVTGPGDARLIAGCLAAGAVGAAATQLGASIVLPELRRPWLLARTTAAGAALGLIYYAAEHTILDGRVLFLVWQPAIAYAIGTGLAPRARVAR
jgi:hypothetical protein